LPDTNTKILTLPTAEASYTPPKARSSQNYLVGKKPVGGAIRGLVWGLIFEFAGLVAIILITLAVRWLLRRGF